MRSPGLVTAARQAVRVGLERLLGLTIARPQHGVRDTADVLACGCRVDVIFDVGANAGQTAARLRRAFPSAAIHCFEPVHATFDELQTAAADDPKVFCHRLALGAAPAETSIFVTDNSVTCSLHRPEHYLREERVIVTTIDDFCRERGISRIDLLKIDAEGHDLEVVQGASGMLAEGRVAMVLAEVGFTPGDDRHVLFDDVRGLLLPHGFSLLGIYGQQPEWSGEKKLRFANALFTCEPSFASAGAQVSKDHHG
jgi:FkbM family methyltransferase